jgi:hypothetical protein
VPITELSTSPQYSYNEGNPVVTVNLYGYPYDYENDVRKDLTKFDLYQSTTRSGLPQDPPMTLALRDVQITKDPNNRRGWFVSLIFKDLTGRRLNIDPRQPNDDGYVTMRMSTEGRFVDTFRQWMTETEFLTAVRLKTDARKNPLYGPFEAQADIGGKKIDIAGTPTSVVMPMQRIVVDITTTQFPQMRFLRKFLGARNGGSFLGCEAFTAVCQGMEASEMQPGRWKLSINFEIDKHLHLKQVPMRNAAGYVELDHGGDTNALGRGQAARVIWVQPYPEVEFFEEMHPALERVQAP